MRNSVIGILCAALSATAALACSPPARAGATIMGAGDAQSLKLVVGMGVLLRLDRPAATVFVAEPRIADVDVKSPTLVYVLGRATGATTVYALDGGEHVVANMNVTVGFDEERLRALIRAQAPRSHVEVATAGGAIVLTGQVSSAAEGEDVLRLAAQFAPGDDKSEHVVNRLTVPGPNQINLRVRVAEVDRTATDALGVNWEVLAPVGATTLGMGIGNQILSTTTPVQVLRGPNNVENIYAGYQKGAYNVNLLLDALTQKGEASILAEPNLTAVSGEPASFLAGGEYPIPVPAQGSANQITVTYKQYGVSLSFVATILHGGRISLNVRPEVSQLTSTGSIEVNGFTVPALTTRRAETTVELASGQSFAIAGLLQNISSRTLNALPGLGEAPVIGALFRSKNFQANKSELVIVVTPYLVEPTDQPLVLPDDPLNPAPRPKGVAAVSPPKKG